MKAIVDAMAKSGLSFCFSCLVASTRSSSPSLAWCALPRRHTKVERFPKPLSLMPRQGKPGIQRENVREETMNDKRRHHDMGGLEAGPVDQSEHDKAPWEKRVDALMRLLSDQQRRMIRVDELRRAIEDLGPDVYDRYSYYERWMSAITELMLEKGVITVAELGERMAIVEAREQEARR